MNASARHLYRFTLSERDYETLQWLADRGYDGGLLKLATLVSDPYDVPTQDDGRYHFTLTEPAAWAWREAIDGDPDAYLTCNGSVTLSEELRRLENEIV